MNCETARLSFCAPGNRKNEKLIFKTLEGGGPVLNIEVNRFLAGRKMFIPLGSLWFLFFFWYLALSSESVNLRIGLLV